VRLQRLDATSEALGRRTPVRVLALYKNGKDGEWTFIETGPDGMQDATGTMVIGTLDEIKAKLQP